MTYCTVITEEFTADLDSHHSHQTLFVIQCLLTFPIYRPSPLCLPGPKLLHQLFIHVAFSCILCLSVVKIKPVQAVVTVTEISATLTIYIATADVIENVV